MRREWHFFAGGMLMLSVLGVLIVGNSWWTHPLEGQAWTAPHPLPRNNLGAETIEDPKITDWISAAAAVVQTIGALLAIWVTARIARRGERESARREIEARDREDAARLAADERAEVAIERAARAEQQRALDRHRQIAMLAAKVLTVAIADLEEQSADVAGFVDKPNPYGPTPVALDWTVANRTLVTLRALEGQISDPFVSTRIAQALASLQQPERLGNWSPGAAERMLQTVADELKMIRDNLENT